jgi:hypothetical protein
MNQNGGEAVTREAIWSRPPGIPLAIYLVSNRVRAVRFPQYGWEWACL